MVVVGVANGSPAAAARGEAPPATRRPVEKGLGEGREELEGVSGRAILRGHDLIGACQGPTADSHQGREARVGK